MRFIAIAVAGASMAAAQTSQVFHLTQNETQQQMNEIATTIRSIGNIRQIMADATQGTVSVSGTAAQLDMAGLLGKGPAPPAPPSWTPLHPLGTPAAHAVTG